jgi:hypothetical protein
LKAFLNHFHNLLFETLSLNSHIRLFSKRLFSFTFSENFLYASGTYRLRS